MTLNEYAKDVNKANSKWWLDLTKPCKDCNGKGTKDQIEIIYGPESGLDEYRNFGPKICTHCDGDGYSRLASRNVGELLMLVTSELAEALEGNRKNLMDDKLPHRRMFEVEIVDAFIRLFDIAGGMNLDLDGAYKEKMEYNSKRASHSIAGRLSAGGKKY